VFGEKAKEPDSQAAVNRMREDYEHQLDAKYAAARGYVDTIVIPEETRDQVAFLLYVATQFGGPHLGAFVL
ncbi:MAG: acyl-CoA carboxylase subunit beta, partial [Gemmatimonadota bacterium]|nr:acyl-CoA carboxylase subunit beta [Gemmatimonadota bacterium]